MRSNARPMDNGNTFSYTYSAPENLEILRIRKIYLPLEEHQPPLLPGPARSLCTGIGGALLLGLGVCLAMILACPIYLK